LAILAAIRCASSRINHWARRSNKFLNELTCQRGVIY
jgi:hypothetical protein